ncbi:hypothetical protein LOZ44_006812 [Ophidiomyces ophidiicola]|nr:hypothetical protein LOZ44_006812 [Ophidiomyces ophidiicola]
MAATAAATPPFRLRVALAAPRPAIPAGQSCELEATVHNDDDAVLTVLAWNNLLDPSAGLLGVFEVRDRDSGQDIPTAIIQMSRMLPPLPDHLVEIRPGESTVARVVLDAITLPPNRTYSVVAKGRWQSVWRLPKDEVVAKHLSDQETILVGDFLSNPIEVSQVSGLPQRRPKREIV